MREVPLELPVGRKMGLKRCLKRESGRLCVASRWGRMPLAAPQNYLEKFLSAKPGVSPEHCQGWVDHKTSKQAVFSRVGWGEGHFWLFTVWKSHTEGLEWK